MPNKWRSRLFNSLIRLVHLIALSTYFTIKYYFDSLAIVRFRHLVNLRSVIEFEFIVYFLLARKPFCCDKEFADIA